MKKKKKKQFKMTTEIKSVDTVSLWNSRLTSNEYTQRRITFGKHRGTMIKDIPLEYIQWGIINFRSGFWGELFVRELRRRQPKSLI